MAKLTKDDIRKLLEAAPPDITHVIIMSDDFSHEYYPVYVKRGVDPCDVVKRRDGKKMQRMKEVYNLAEELEPQLKRAMNVRY